jgi:hypothetical protein
MCRSNLKELDWWLSRGISFFLFFKIKINIQDNLLSVFKYIKSMWRMWLYNCLKIWFKNIFIFNKNKRPLCAPYVLLFVPQTELKLDPHANIDFTASFYWTNQERLQIVSPNKVDFDWKLLDLWVQQFLNLDFHGTILRTSSLELPSYKAKQWFS